MAAPPHPLGCQLRIELPLGGRAIIASDLLLASVRSASATRTIESIATELRALEGDGILVVAGNCFDLSSARSSSAGPASLLASALEVHPDLVDAIGSFADPDDEVSRRVVLLPGVRDRAICYDAAATALLAEVGIEVALSVEIEVVTGTGHKLVRVEPGWAYDEKSRFSDPTDPHDTPLGHHAVTEVFPSIAESPSRLLEGVDRLADPGALPRLVASRLFYRRFGRYAWWLLVPLVLVLLLGRLPGFWLFGAPVHLRTAGRLVVDVAVTVVLELLAAAVLLGVVNHRLWRGPGNLLVGPAAASANDAAREEARSFVAAGGGGLITGHSLQPEIASVGRGFFASTGASAAVTEERRGLFFLPPVFADTERVSLVAVEGGANVHARLTLSADQMAPGSLLEKLAAGPRRTPVIETVVGSYPGPSYPTVSDPLRRHRLIRRLAAALVAAIGALDLVSALVPPPVRGQLHPYLGYVPLGVSAAAGAFVALAGIALVFVARGLRRGHRLAYLIAVSVLALTALLHIVREGQWLSSLASIAVVAALLWGRDAFRAGYEPAAVRTALLTLLGGAVAVPVFVTVVLEFAVRFDKDHGPLPWGTALAAAVERLVGIDAVALPRLAAEFLDPAELAVGIALAVVALAICFRPVAQRRAFLGGRRSHPARRTELERARDIVRRRGQGTLDYFALRGDKQHYFERDGLVAYAVHNGVALVSPDPICPPEERRSLWSAFRAFVDANGWSVAVLGAAQEWLPVYQSSGMHDLYIGDEGVVDVTALSLEGGTRKGLRQAVNRIARYGYTMSFHDPARLGDELALSLRQLAEKTRRGEAERGFSMTLGRLFDPFDEGLLLAVAHGPDGAPVAFCQFVPAPGIGGYSLDLMRRDPGEHPNGLLDFVLVRTMEHLRDEGQRRLGLNFAMMRAVLAGETGSSLTTRLERFVLKKMSDSMQIESLWRFTAKFDPAWLARYVVWDSAENSLAAALAIARAESFWELPLIGRFLTPDRDGALPVADPAGATRRAG